MNSEFKRTGQRFGNLTVISKALPTGRSYHWLCRCDCGETRTVEEMYKQAEQRMKELTASLSRLRR